MNKEFLLQLGVHPNIINQVASSHKHILSKGRGRLQGKLVLNLKCYEALLADKSIVWKVAFGKGKSNLRFENATQFLIKNSVGGVIAKRGDNTQLLATFNMIIACLMSSSFYCPK